ncbi:MAG: WecB/TagA/CpsF family glycosyltransferase [Candidatus Eremiobacteraeota bacterium]|nr:WecB/TagA/CpsF family glycosyltransferase [Candidatus Eremiobacteraeota bacterium]MCW5872710.1 WecB/TagA/CpsF family glycosyltransferase [Candidatus Eremiobacteraeota bacterium]
MAQTLDILRGYLKTDAFHLVVTIGSEMIVRAQTDHEFREAVCAAALVVPDSIGAVLAARYAGYPLRERVTGVELTQRMAQELGPALRVFLLGGAPGVAETAAHKLLSLGPGIHIAGTHDGYFKDDAEIVAKIKTSGANVLLVALGFPRQELWLTRHGAACGVQVGIGVGGTFDVLAGRVQRAPRVFQKLGLEWFYRLTLQPSRWRRMLALPKFALRVLSGGKQAVRPMASS